MHEEEFVDLGFVPDGALEQETQLALRRLAELAPYGSTARAWFSRGARGVIIRLEARSPGHAYVAVGTGPNGRVAFYGAKWRLEHELLPRLDEVAAAA